MTRRAASLRAASLRVASWGLAVAAGCAPGAQGDVRLAIGDVPSYAEHVHPVLEGACATLDCHGASGRPLQLYAEMGLRLRDDLRTHPGLPTIPLTAEELAANVLAIAVVDADEGRVDSRLILRKPLSRTGGGVDHRGGQLWPGPEDVAYLCVRSWLVGSIDAEACARAKARDGLPPP